VDVTVVNPDGQRGMLGGAFTFNEAPTITSILPPRGSSVGGTPVTIIGEHFHAGATVSFDGIDATQVTVVDGGRLTAVAPAHAEGYVDVAVVNPDGQRGTLFHGFIFVAAPTITALDTSTGPTAGGSRVIITGTGFAHGAKVLFGDVPATSVVFQDATAIAAWTPRSPSGAVEVILVNPDGQSATAPGPFTFMATAPKVLSITPDHGSTEGGTRIAVTGSGFVQGASLKVGGVDATRIEVVSDTTITADAPAHAAGKVEVVVTNPDGQTAATQSGFQYVDYTFDAGIVEQVDAGTPNVADAGTGGSGGNSSGCSSTQSSASTWVFALLSLGMIFTRRKAAR
jgi:uncharacterized protein (TIGR03382 family)